MKKQLIKLASFLLILLFMNSGKLNAQNCCSTFTIENQRNCTITVFWEVAACPAYGSGTVTLVSGQIITLSSTPGGDMFVWLLEIDGIDVTYGSNAFAVSGGCFGVVPVNGAPVPSTVSAPCQGSGSYTLLWNSGGCVIQ
jgi:hypothetical protein